MADDAGEWIVYKDTADDEKSKAAFEGEGNACRASESRVNIDMCPFTSYCDVYSDALCFNDYALMISHFYCSNPLLPRFPMPCIILAHPKNG